MRLRVAVDRVEGNTAVLIPREGPPAAIHWPLELLPAGTREGAILDLEARVDEGETERVRRRVQGLIDDLARRSRQDRE
ncbi:MAG: DUF3006 domain-containing protein [bacterium]|nr:DUF3006 domain-containing protein [bacterium]